MSHQAFSALPAGLKVFRYGFFVSQAESFWVGDRQNDFAGNGKTQFIFNDISVKYGWKHGIELNGGITYANTEQKRGNEGGTNPGDKQNGISSLKLGAARKIWGKGNYSIEGSFEFEHPFDRGPSSDFDESPDVFIARNDGSIHYSIGLTQNYVFNESFSTSLQAVYIARDTGLNDQLKLDLFLSYNVNQKFQVGVAFNKKDTFGGLDIGSAAFSAESTARSTGGDSRIRAFSLVREEVFGASVFSAYQVDGKWSVDAYINRKLDGRNTDIATSVGAGLTYLVW